MARISLYLIGIAAGVAAIITYRNRGKDLSNTDSRLPVLKAADMLREAWGEHRTPA
jgi:hypothetical protein